MPFAVVILCLLLAALALFQASLILGAPLGRFAWGGADRVLPPRRRIASAVAIVLYAVFVAVFLAQAGVLPSVLPAAANTVIAWVIVAYLALGTLANALSKSRRERWTMAPLSAVLTLLGVLTILG